MQRYKRIIAFSLVLILPFVASAPCLAAGSHGSGSFSNPDAIKDADMFDEQKGHVDVNLPAPADTTIQSTKNKNGDIVHILHWRNPASLVPFESDDLKVQVCAEFTIQYNQPGGEKGELKSDRILLGSTSYTTADSGYSTNLNDNVARYLHSIQDTEDFANHFGYLKTLVDDVMLTPEELATAISAALRLDVGTTLGNTFSKNVQVLDDAYHFSANFEYKSVKYYLRYYKEKNSTLCEKGSDGKYHASLTLYNNQMIPGVSSSYPFFGVGDLGDGESCTYEYVSDYPIICCVDNPIVTCLSQWNSYYDGEYHDLEWCSGGSFNVDMYSFLSDGSSYCIGGFSGSASGEGKAPLKVGIEDLFDVSNAGLFSGYGDGSNPCSPPPEDLTKLYTDFMAGNPDPDVFTSATYQASVWTSVAANFTPKSSSGTDGQTIEKEQTVTTYDEDGNEVSVDVSGIEGWLAKIYKKECEILNWIKLNLIVNIADNIFDALIGDISAAASSLSNTSSTAFPVSIYKDVITVSTLLAADPVTPKFTLRLYYPGLVDAKEEISFEQFETMHNLLVAFMTLFCIASLFPLTRHTLDIMSRIKGGSS